MDFVLEPNDCGEWGWCQVKSVMSEQMALSLVRPHPFEAVLSPELSGVGVLKSPWRTWSFLGRQMIFLFLTLQGHLPGKSGPGNRVSVLEETPWDQICAGSRAHLPGHSCVSKDRAVICRVSLYPEDSLKGSKTT